MTITGKNEVAVDNQLRRAEKQNQSPVTGLFEGAETATQAISLVTGSVTIGGIAKAFGIAKRFTSGLGVATLAENLDHLGDAAETALSRVEKNLAAQGVRIDEVERRLNSDELLEGIKAATLQAQRTKDKKRLDRMALILANGVAENDLEPESLDDMMRAAVELKDRDIGVLAEIYKMQLPMFDENELKRQRNERTDHLHRIWQDWWNGNVQKYAGLNGVIFNGSCMRLHALGLISALEGRSHASQPTSSDYELLLAGKKFYERLQEIADDPEEMAL